MEVDIGVVPQRNFRDCPERKRSAIEPRVACARGERRDHKLSAPLRKMLLARPLVLLTLLCLRRGVAKGPLHGGQA